MCTDSMWELNCNKRQLWLLLSIAFLHFLISSQTTEAACLCSRADFHACCEAAFWDRLPLCKQGPTIHMEMWFVLLKVPWTIEQLCWFQNQVTIAQKKMWFDKGTTNGHCIWTTMKTNALVFSWPLFEFWTILCSGTFGVDCPVQSFLDF